MRFADRRCRAVFRAFLRPQSLRSRSPAHENVHRPSKTNCDHRRSRSSSSALELSRRQGRDRTRGRRQARPLVARPCQHPKPVWTNSKRSAQLSRRRARPGRARARRARMVILAAFGADSGAKWRRCAWLSGEPSGCRPDTAVSSSSGAAGGGGPLSSMPEEMPRNGRPRTRWGSTPDPTAGHPTP